MRVATNWICLFALAGAVPGLLAQQPHATWQARGRPEMVISDGAFAGAEMMPGHAVKGAPYSAQAVNEFTQVLGDGTRINNSHSGMVARDSEGRTRREHTGPAMGPVRPAMQMVVIHDPVAGVTYFLNPEEKVANKLPLPKMLGPAEAAAQEIAFAPRGGGAVGLVSRAGMHEAGAVMFSTKPHDPAREGKKEPLGTRNIEGVQAEGTRTTFTIPTGEMGNDRPIEVVSERWYSSQLQTVVMSRHSDPRTGENVFRLTNIVRGEPSRTLFEVPPDYTIKDNIDTKVRVLRHENKEE